MCEEDSSLHGWNKGSMALSGGRFTLADSTELFCGYRLRRRHRYIEIDDQIRLAYGIRHHSIALETTVYYRNTHSRRRVYCMCNSYTGTHLVPASGIGNHDIYVGFEHTLQRQSGIFIYIYGYDIQTPLQARWRSRLSGLGDYRVWERATHGLLEP